VRWSNLRVRFFPYQVMIKGDFNALMNHVGEIDFYRTSEYGGWHPCILVDGFIFIWKSMISCLEVQKEEEKIFSINQFYAGTKE